MGSCLSSSSPKSKNIVKIVYSTTTGTSKNAADKLQEYLQDKKFVTTVSNIGDFPYQQLPRYQGTVIFLLSTYGNGDSPADGQKFLNWIEKIDTKKHSFENLRYAILAFGNSSFQNHCGFALRVDKILKQCRGKQILQLTKCDASSQQNNVSSKIPNWSKKLINNLNEIQQLKQIQLQEKNINSKYQAKIQQISGFDWQQEAKNNKNLPQQFVNFLNMPKYKVQFIKQLRKNCSEDRSTVWIRILVDNNIKLTPACNIDVFPQNIIPASSKENDIISWKQNNGKVPFPKMSYQNLMKIVDLRSKCSTKQLKKAIQLSTVDAKIISKYQQYLNKKSYNCTVKQLLDKLKPKTQFLQQLSLNRVRTYTLSSWDKDQKYIDLTISLLKDGLASNYFRSKPTFMRIKSINSSFYIPKNQPIALIANGSGIAPMRSITEYISHLSPSQRPTIKFFYGMQSRQTDYYFKQQWQKYQKQGFLQMMLAQSRRDPSKKQYVQQKLQKEISWLQDHLLQKKGVIYICGGSSMSKDLNQIFLKAITNKINNDIQAFNCLQKMKKQKIIVQQVYG